MALGGRIHGDNPALGILVDDALQHRFCQQPVALFTLPQRLRRRFALGGQQSLRLCREGSGAGAMQGLGDPSDHRTGQHEEHQPQPIGRLYYGEPARRLDPEVIGQYRRQSGRHEARARPP